MAYSKQTAPADVGRAAADLISQRIAELDDWRGEALARMRKLLLAADPGVVEEWKWGGPVWSCDGIICTGETYKAAVKLTFPKGAALKDPSKLFNASLEGATRRALDIPKGAKPDEAAFKALVREAIAANRGGAAAKKPSTKAAVPTRAAAKKK